MLFAEIPLSTAPIERNATRPRIKIIDVDTHLSEPADLWLKHAPASLRDRVPQIKEHGGRISWVIDGDKPIGFGGSLSSAVRKDGTKALDVEDFGRLAFEDIHPGAYDLKPRLQEMDRCGIYAEIVYPNILGFGGQACRAAPLSQTLGPAALLQCFPVALNVPCLERR